MSANKAIAWFTIEDAAQYVGVSERTIHRWVDERRLLAHQLVSGGGRRFRRQDLDELLTPERGQFDMRVHEFIQQAQGAGHAIESDTGSAEGPAYRQFRCSVCGGLWFVSPQEVGIARPDGHAWTIFCGTRLDRLPSAHQLVARFRQWEAAASMSPNRRVAESAPLAAPCVEEAASMLPRLAELRDRLAKDGRDWHGRTISQPLEAALGQLWEEWRDTLLGFRNGYREVWNSPAGFEKML
ncbi:MAG TPA: helix-turn-helix domain-containing protein [Candidatus Micrarchaeaceae archaeon]|nr:helix-turn-helix domain-containing protein [Candidatus Micrarchaeaceae archaeon]HVC78863.1 helix-turn-helix domain-containing protein [Candidatus Micrarchaeaceae archaeon]